MCVRVRVAGSPPQRLGRLAAQARVDGGQGAPSEYAGPPPAGPGAAAGADGGRGVHRRRDL